MEGIHNVGERRLSLRNMNFMQPLVLVGKCTIGATNAIIQTFTAYQYPTQMRNLGVGAGNFAAGIALIIVPYLWLLVRLDVGQWEH